MNFRDFMDSIDHNASQIAYVNETSKDEVKKNKEKIELRMIDCWEKL